MICISLASTLRVGHAAISKVAILHGRAPELEPVSESLCKAALLEHVGRVGTWVGTSCRSLSRDHKEVGK